MPLSNAFVMASLDPSNSPSEWKSLKESGWSTMFFGDNEARFTPNGDPLHMCKKTWFKMKGVCGKKCQNGCFSSKRVDVHLKQH